MEQRLTVHAGHHTQALSARRIRRWAWLLALPAVMLSASAADARPRKRNAKAAFDRGVAAYQKHNFAAASDALARSFELERDADTLFAWAQAQRQLGNYARAIELYDTLLSFKLPAKNRAAVEAQLAECGDLLAAQQPKVVQPPKVAVLPDEQAPAEPPAAARVAPEPPSSERSVSPGAPPDPMTPAAPVAEAPAVNPQAWYKDPIALGLAGSGVLVTAVGGGLLYTAWSLDKDSKAAFAANQYDTAQSLADKAKSRDTLAVVTMGVGGLLVVGSVVWIATHRSKEQVVTGWVAPGSAGLAVVGAF